MITEFRRHAPTHEFGGMFTINQRQSVELVENYKYFITVFHSGLICNKNCEAVCKMGHQHLSCLRNLSCFNTDVNMLTFFYRAFNELVLSFSLVSWFLLPGSAKQKLPKSYHKVDL